ncbi:2-oxoglutarate oxidoreductase, alpha subunit [Chitinispirillum alkaliphilum]|nr:2-oxoglutarate oxidoreductase, alpha subunit [Chitinispirillum alkaliphilum]
MTDKHDETTETASSGYQTPHPEGISIVLAGGAGHGIQSIEAILVNVLKKDGYHVFATKEYMSRIRGGVNSTQIRVSEKPVRSYVEGTDIFIPLDQASYERCKKNLKSTTAVLADASKLQAPNTIDIPFEKVASESGNPLFANTVSAGVICGILDVSQEILYEYITTVFSKKGDDVVNGNIKAAQSGYLTGSQLKQSVRLTFNTIKKNKPTQSLLLSGTEAVTFGALAGGCDSCFAYPMTPSTGVFTQMASFAERAGVAVEQVEDEIGVVNMALGAWYAGARPLVSTSGGGFALMTEGISLAGMIESPLVIHLAQRPGPATGLPTRTEQGDLNLALYAGHGVFPRIILAPGDTEQAFELSAQAFTLADQYQVPVFILTDQYFVDTYYDIPQIRTENIKTERFITETTKDYKRYTLTEDGFSPRGIPGFGSGLVCTDSDEHDQSARITEELDDIALEMKNKRYKKFDSVKENALPPVLIGEENYSRLIVGWGSVYNTVIEAMSIIDNSQTAFLFFPQLYPIHHSASELLQKASTVIAVENNQTAQFAQLLTKETGVGIDCKILKYNGMPFSVEEVAEALNQG